MIYERTSQAVKIAIAPLSHDRTDQAADVLARGMLDYPMHIAVYGSDPIRRMHSLRRVYRNMIPMMSTASHSLMAVDEFDDIVGVCGVFAPGECRQSREQRNRLMESAMVNGPDVLVRMSRWFGAWDALDPEIRHWHIGPLAVDMPFQGMGIGTALITQITDLLDDANDAAYLETDDSGNVEFYKRFGFQVIDEQVVLGIPNWFMLRPAGAKGI